MRQTSSTSFVFALAASVFLPVAVDAEPSSRSVSEIANYGVAKSRLFFQEDASGPAAAPQAGYLFVVSVEMAEPGMNASATVTLPGGGERTLQSYPGSATLNYFEVFDSEAALHAAFPFGVHTFTVTVDGETRAAQLDFPAAPFPPAPAVVDFEALQAVDPDQPLAVAWEPFSGGGPGDYIHLEIEDFRSPAPWEDDFLDGTATGTVVPASVLEAGAEFVGRLSFSKVLGRNTSALGGAFGDASIASWTEFSVVTGGQPEGLSVSGNPVPDAEVGESFSFTFEASGGSGNYLWAVDDGESLPPGVTFDPMTGTLSGTPEEAGTFGFTVMVVDLASAANDTREVELSVTSAGGGDPGEPPVVVAGFTADGSSAVLTLEAEAGTAVVVEASEDLENWTEIHAEIAGSGALEFPDTDVGEHASRFYRVRVP